MKKVLIAMLATITLVSAAPAFPHRHTFVQPDGTRFAGYVRGDEHLHWIESAQDREVLVYVRERRRYEPAMIEAEQLQGSGKAYGRVQAREYRPSKEALYRLWQKNVRADQ